MQISLYHSSKNYGDNGSNLTASSVYADWEDAVAAGGSTAFIGVILSNGDSGTVQRAFACNISHGVPYCVEGTRLGSSSKYKENTDVLGHKALFPNASGQNACLIKQNQVTSYGTANVAQCMDYIPSGVSSISAADVTVYSTGQVTTGISKQCNVYPDGTFKCATAS